MRRLFAVLLAATVIAAITIPAFAQPEKVTICHAAGQEGTLQFVELTLAYNAAYGQAGHFLEPGSPNAGHEHDIEGPCPTTTTSTTSTTSSTTTPTTSSSTTTSSTTTTVTTVPSSSTTTVDSTTTTTLPLVSTTLVALTTPTTLPFTGDNSGVMVGLAASLLAAGALLLLTLRSRNETG